MAENWPCATDGTPQNIKHIGLACSGGGDSMALACLAQSWCQEHRIQLHVAIVDHLLRPDSGKEALATQQWLDARGIKADILRDSSSAPKNSRLQEKARSYRYKLLGDWMEQKNLSILLVGHNFDDQVETILLRLSRGSHWRGLKGMAASSPLSPDGLLSTPPKYILRPLLSCRRTQLRQFLNDQDWPFLNDPANDNPEFTRIWWRQHLPHFAKTGITEDSLTRLSDLAKRMDALRQTRLHSLCNQRLWMLPGGAVRSDHGLFQDAGPDLGSELLRGLLTFLGTRTHGPRQAAVDRLYHKICFSTDHTQPAATLHGVRLITNQQGLLFLRENPAPPVKLQKLKLQKFPIIWDQRYRLYGDDLSLLDQWTLGAVGKGALDEKLKKQAQLPATVLKTLPCLRNPQGEIRHIPDLDYYHPDQTNKERTALENLSLVFSRSSPFSFPLSRLI